MHSHDLRTARLDLRPLTTPDLDALHRLLTQPGVRRYLLDDEVISREQAQFFIDTSVASFDASGYGLWGAATKGHDALIGFCGFWRFHEPPQLELLYGLGDDHRGQGLATEMAVAMIRYGFDRLRFDRIEASGRAERRIGGGDGARRDDLLEARADQRRRHRVLRDPSAF